MPALLIEGIPPWDGRYEFDWGFTNLELHRIKEISGVRAGELAEALAASDAAVIVAVAKIVLDRNHKHVDVDELWGGDGGSLRIDLGSDARPPEPAPSESDPTASTPTSGPASESTGG